MRSFGRGAIERHRRGRGREFDCAIHRRRIHGQGHSFHHGCPVNIGFRYEGGTRRRPGIRPDSQRS